MYKHKVFIQQILSKEIVIETKEPVINKEYVEKYLKEHPTTPTYALAYYDRQVSKVPVYKDWILDNETIMILDSEKDINCTSKSKFDNDIDDGYND